MKRTVWHALSMLVCGLAVFVLPALADSQARIVRLSYLSGSVQIDRNSGQEFEKAIMNMPVIAGAQLKTADGQAEVEFENGSTVRLTPETRVAFDGLSLLDNGTKVSVIMLQKGVAYFNLNHKDHNEFKVQIAGRDLDLKKSAHFRADVGRDQVRLAVFSGEVNVVGPGKSATVHKNETLSFDLLDQSRYVLAKGIDEYQFDGWDRQREQYQSQYARVNYASGSGAPYYGWDDLNYYGGFSYIPGYGYMWRPYGVGYGWDPFAVGYWMSYPGWGYTWISPYAWGWTPYRYGGWQFVSGYGWWWRPGPWRNWNTVVPVIGAPPNYRPPRPPSVLTRGIIAIGNPHPMAPSPSIKSFSERGNRGGQGTRVMPLPTPNIATDVPQNVPGERLHGRSESPAVSPTNPPRGPARGADSPQRTYTPPPSSPPPGRVGPSGGGSVGRGGMGTVGGAGSMGSSMGGGSMRGSSGSTGSGGHSGGNAGGRSPR
jgi:hypothetical protein